MRNVAAKVKISGNFCHGEKIVDRSTVAVIKSVMAEVQLQS